MKVSSTSIPDVLIIEPKVFGDARGLFYESFNECRFFESTGIRPTFVQDNHTISVKGALHGLHYQICLPQSKLVRVVAGEVFDVAVDLRTTSPTFGCWTGTTLSAENRLQMWIPSGFAHGFLVLSDVAELLYKVTDYYAPQHERCIAWNDPDIGAHWPIDAPQLSARDMLGQRLASAEVFA